MATTLLMRRQLGALRPTDVAGEEALRALRGDELVKVVITRMRNARFHRKYFALLNVVYPHQETYATFDHFRDAIACAVGHGDVIKLDDGRSMLVARSISFASMDETSFGEFYERVLTLILTRIVPGVGRADLEREVADIIAGRAAC